MMEMFHKLRESIESELRKAADIPYRYRKMPATVAPPFGVYMLDLVSVDDYMAQYSMTLELADYDNSADRLDELADDIALHMNYLTVFDNSQWWKSHLDNRTAIDESDKNIQRIRLTFEVRYVFRGGGSE